MERLGLGQQGQEVRDGEGRGRLEQESRRGRNDPEAPTLEEHEQGRKEKVVEETQKDGKEKGQIQKIQKEQEKQEEEAVFFELFVERLGR